MPCSYHEGCNLEQIFHVLLQESNGARATRAAKRKATQPAEATLGKRVLRAKPRVSYATAEYESDEELDEQEEEESDEEVKTS